MRKIDIDVIGNELKHMLLNPDPVDEDILVQNSKGELLGAVITAQAYEFFLSKVEELEDHADKQTIKDFHKFKK